MLFWILAAAMTILALGLVLAPLARARAQSGPGEDVGIALYTSQLEAIADAERAGRISAEDAHATRNEIKRRMLAAARAMRATTFEAEGATSAIGARRVAILVVGIALPLLTLTIYLTGGSPFLPDRPYASRGAERVAAGLPSDQEKALVRELAQRMAEDPQDSRGWVLLGAAYVRQGRYDEAVAAYESAKTRKPGDAEILSALGEAEVLQNGGEITEEARANFEAALKIAPDDVRARYFIALAKAQAGDFDGAVAGWQALIASAPPDSPWKASVEAQIAQARKSQEQAGEVLGPGVAEAAAKLSPAERQAMIERMVDGLAARLQKSPNDLQGWLRLARSYSVLGDAGKAVVALDRAAQQFRGDASALSEIDKERQELAPAMQRLPETAK